MDNSASVREAVLEASGHVLVLGGPGSGKTTIALQKADREINSGRLQPSQRIIFLSFARATVARVAEQAAHLLLASDSKWLEINTYHGFCWSLLRSHGYLLAGPKQIRLLPPPEAATRLAAIPGQKRPAEIRRLFNEEGILHFDLFADLCSTLLASSSSLARILSDTYPFIILDEFQDTNSDEWRLIQTLGSRSQLMSLADPDQRIYEFRGADPNRISEFITKYAPAAFDFGTENHRSQNTDIVQFGNELLTEANRGKTYNNVTVARYGFYQNRSPHFPLKTALIQGIKRQIQPGASDWSIAVLVPTKRLMLAVSDYLDSTTDHLPALSHEVALDTEGPALAASVIAILLEGSAAVETTAGNLIRELCSHIRGRRGNTPPTQADLQLTSALLKYLETGSVRGAKRQRIVADCIRIGEMRHQLQHSGDPSADWLAVRKLLADSTEDTLQQVAEDAKYLRLLHKGAALRASLGLLWRTHRSYLGASTAVRDALLQEHFSASTRIWHGVHVMTIHKSKGKEFEEVLIYEGVHQGRILRDDVTDRERAQARLSLRVAVTRAKQRTTILTPKQAPRPFL